MTTHPVDSLSHIVNQCTGFSSRSLRVSFPHQRSLRSMFFSASHVVAPVGSGSAATLRRYIDTPHERPGCEERAT